jgi:hypothetical protein
MYGGTAKEISALVSTIHRLATADEDKPQLIVVVVDE